MARLVSLTFSFVSLASVAGLGACGDDLDTTNRDAEPDAPTPGADEGVAAPGIGLAVVHGDFVSTSISLLDANGQVTRGDCITSGTRPPGSTLALSGDVVLPSQPQAGNLVLALDRSNAALTWIDPSTCAPLRQLDVSTGGFFANPHDVISISPTKAYVARYEPNDSPTPDAGDFDEGNDLLIIDPSIPAVTGRIDMASHAVAVPGATVLARPDRALHIGSKVYVALSNLDGDFQIGGHGRIVVVDPATDQVTGTIDIPTLKNCSTLSYVESTQTLVVACAGVFADADQAAASGIAYIDLAASPPAVVRTQSVAPFAGRPVADFSAIALDGALGFGVTFGEFGATPTDQLWALDVAAGSATKIADSAESFTYGGVLVDRSHQRVYLTDANPDEPRVRAFGYAAGTAPVALPPVNTSPTVGLPPRQILWY